MILKHTVTFDETKKNGEKECREHDDVDDVDDDADDDADDDDAD